MSEQGGDRFEAHAPVVAAENAVLAAAHSTVDDTGLEVYPAGVGGLFTAFIGTFEGIDSSLLLTALGGVVLILLVVYRSPVLWVFPLLSALLALGAASMIVYVLAKADLVTLNGQSQGILFVLVIGAGTDYALLLISRYREELHIYPNRFDAMIRAWRESVGAITASAVTMTVALLCLMFSELESNKGLGPVAAIGIACTYLVMMTFLPVSLALAGRWVFWPRRPQTYHAVDLATHGLWGRVAAWVGRNDRPAWIGTSVVLILLFIAGIGSLHTDGLTTAESFTTTPDAVTGQELYVEKFDPGAGVSAVVTANVGSADAVIAAASGVAGIATGPGAVCPQIDYAKVQALLAANPGLATAPVSGDPVFTSLGAEFATRHRDRPEQL